MSSLDRVAQIQKAAIPARLRKGAEILGRLWRDGHRCSWSAVCGCGTAANDFCQSKLKWFGLFQETHPDCDFSAVSGCPWFLVEVMVVDGYWPETGLTAQIQMPGAERPIKVGPKGTMPDTIFELCSLPDHDRAAALQAVVRIQAVGL